MHGTPTELYVTPAEGHVTPTEVHGTPIPSVFFAFTYLTHLIIRSMIGSRRLVTREVECLSSDGFYSLRFSSVRQEIPGAEP